MGVYVCSDIHGHADRYFKLKEMLSPSDTLYIAGDVIDRGNGSLEIIKDVMTSKNITMLLGNHELFALRYFKKNDVSSPEEWSKNDTWLLPNNGGEETLEALKKEPLEFRKDFLSFLSGLPLLIYTNVQGKDYAISHSYVFKSVKEKSAWTQRDCDARSVTWFSPYKSSMYVPIEAYPDYCTSIVGHVPVQRIKDDPSSFEVVKEDNVIFIDGGCAYAKYSPNTALICIELGSEEVKYIV